MYKGLVTDTLPSQQPEGTYRFAKNKVIDIDSNVIDEPGFFFSHQVPVGSKMLGTANCPDGSVLEFYLVDAPENPERTGEAPVYFEIFLFEKDTQPRRILSTQYITIDLFKSFKADVTLNNNGERIVIWTNDGPPYMLNIDNPIKGIKDGKLLSPSIVGNMKLFKDMKIPVVTGAKLNYSGGSLKSGAYSIAIAYVNKDGSRTDYLTISNQVNITNGNYINGYKSFDGCEPGLPTSRSITFSLDNLDTRFEGIRIAVIKRIDGVISCAEIGSFSIESEDFLTISKDITISGTEPETAILLDEILIGTLKYDRVKTFAFTDKYLIVANFSTDEIYNYQKMANEIEVSWVYEDSVGLDGITGSHKDGGFTFLNKSFMPGEVYAFYLSWIMNDGRRTPRFHIPGRKVRELTINGTTISENDLIADIKSAIPYLEHDAKISPEVKYFHTRETASLDGTMGYWENKEKYPLEFPTGKDGEILAGTPVRHHKFPSLSLLNNHKPFVSNMFNSDQTGTEIGQLEIAIDYEYIDANSQYIIPKIRVISNTIPSFNPVTWIFSENITLKIDFNLFAGVEEPEGQVVVGIGLKHNNLLDYIDYESSQGTAMIEGQKYSNVFANSELKIDIITFGYHLINVGNSIKITAYENQINGTEGSAFGTILGFNLKNIKVPSQYIGKIQGFEIYYAKRNLANSTVIAQSILFKDQWYEQSPAIGYGGIPSKISFPAFDLLANELHPAISPTHLKNELIVGMGEVWSGNETYESPSEENLIRPLTKAAYRPLDLEKQTERTLALEIEAGSSVNSSLAYLASLCAFKEDVYSLFNYRELVFTGRTELIPKSASDETVLRVDKIYGGDTFINEYGIRMTKVKPSGSSEDYDKVFSFICHTALPACLRHEGKEHGQKYYPKYLIPVGDPPIPETPVEGYDYSKDYDNYIMVNTDYSALNTFRQPVPNTKSLRVAVDFPDDMAFTIITGKDESSYSLFLPRNYYQLTRTRGAITNIEWNGKQVLINTEASLFRTITQVAMKSDAEDVILGAPDLFALAPEEVFASRENYPGCQHISGCMMSKHGYTFIDSRTGRIFLLTDKVNEISNYGNSKLIQKLFKFEIEKQLKDQGITKTLLLDNYHFHYAIGYDDVLKRILFVKHGWKLKDPSKLEKYSGRPVAGELYVVDGKIKTKDPNSDSLITIPFDQNYFKPDIVTMSYSTLTNMWVGFHSYHPKRIFSNYDGTFVKLNDLRVYKTGDFEHPRMLPNRVISAIDIPLRADYIPFITSNIVWDSWTTRNSKAKIEGITFDKMVVYNSHQCSFELNINPVYNKKLYWFNKFWDILKNPNAEFIDAEFNLILSQKDTEIQWYEKKRFIDDYIVIRFINSKDEDISVNLTGVSIITRKFNL